MKASIASMTFQESIRSSYSLNIQLVSTLSDTSNASREARETSQFITDLQSRINIATKNLNALQLRVRRLRCEYEGLRDGSTKRLFSKVSGKTDELLAKTNKAEREYQNKFEEQVIASNNLATSQCDLEEAKLLLPHLQDQAAIHVATLSELDELYSSIFSLPHAEYPQETAANQEIGLLQNSISDLQNQIDTESRALKLLTNTRKCLTWSHAAVQNALNADSTGINIVRNAMGIAQLHAMQADSAYDSAKLVQPSIQNMRELKILEENFLLGSSYKPGSDLLLDSTQLTHKMDKCSTEMKPVIDEVGREILVATERIQRLEEEKNELEGEARDILRKARQEVIEFVVEGGEMATDAREAGTDEDAQAHAEPPMYSP
jgi:hypothetical protein